MSSRADTTLPSNRMPQPVSAQKLYRSTTTMVFVPARPDQGQMLAAQNLSRQASAQISTERLARAVDERNPRTSPITATQISPLMAGAKIWPRSVSDVCRIISLGRYPS